MGTPMYLLRITPEQTELDGDSLVRLLGDRDDREKLYASRRMTAIDTAWEWLDELFRGPAREQGGAVMKWIAF